MLKRTKGLLLLTLLVITGLAGTIRDSALSGKERKAATALMKSTRSEVLNSLKGLSPRQLRFKPASDKWSIQDCAYHIATSEKYLWSLLETAMKAPPNTEKRTNIKMSDEELVNAIESRSVKVKTIDPLEPSNAAYKSTDQAMADFKSTRIEHLKYIKTSTEDLRDHVIQLSWGWLDCYQLSLMIAAHSYRHRQQIEEIKADPAFPGK